MTRVEGTVEEQVHLERLKQEEGVNKAVRELHKSIARGEFSDTLYGRVLLKLGYDNYVSKLEEYLTIDISTHNVKVRNLLLLINSNMKEVAYIVLHECINASVRGKSLTQTSIDIVAKLKDIYLVDKLKRNNPKLHTYLGNKFRRANRQKKRELIHKHIEKLYKLGDNAEVDKPLMTQLGTTLINILELSGANVIEVARIPLVNGKSKGGIKSKNIIKLTEEAEEILLNLEYSDINLGNINKLPMVVPPKDWTNNYNGGFYIGKNFLFTTKSSDVLKHLKKKKYPKIYNVINKLQQTPWRVNVKMLDVISTIFNNNMVDPKSPDKAPYLYGELPVRDPYTWEDFINPDMYEKWHDFNNDREDITIRATAEQSKRIEVVYTLAVAEQMKKYSKIYYPYIIDYRGRVYSDVNFLTPQGQSYTKSLLEFGEGRYLTEDGLFWLKVHIANCYGKDKEEYEERIKWFDTNTNLVLEIARDPFNLMSSWVWTDSPFEFLAGCMAYLDHIEGREVYLPIQLDATCSGIQMYSGILRDSKGAEAVNVIGNKRNDIYQIVADKVNNYLKEGKYSLWFEYTDREGVTKSAYAEPVAKSMIGNITRKIVKRNVMTVPYSVTRQGMSNQLWDIIDDAILKGKEFWEGDKWIANKLLTQLNHEAIYDTIDGAKKGQEYLVNLARNLEEPAIWTGVLYDFPLKQTTLTLKEVRVKTIYGTLKLNVETPKLNVRRQSNSIAPNFIHNIDSTILMFCVENIREHIGVIHDCFLVHPNDGYDIQGWYKEGFVTVMKEDPLRNIQKQLDPECIVEFPEYGDLDLNDVYRSSYIIS